MKKGFTLIELLVVVLIIGILAAIALPQYQKAVEKARAAEALISLKALKESYDRYVLANGGSQVPQMDDLDITFSGAIVRTWGYDFRQISPYFKLGFSPSATPHAIRTDSQGNESYVLAYYPNGNGYVCVGAAKDCKALGGTDAGDLCGQGNTGKCFKLNF